MFNKSKMYDQADNSVLDEIIKMCEGSMAGPLKKNKAVTISVIDDGKPEEGSSEEERSESHDEEDSEDQDLDLPDGIDLQDLLEALKHAQKD